MVKLMIVDDEAVIRQGLRKAVDWEQYDIQIVAEAGSGNSALEKAVRYHPDIVISDIRMAEGNGIFLAKRLFEVVPNIKIIMLSGYSDIEYMIEAIKLGVQDYMLKPAGSEQILNSVLKLRDDILQERSKVQQHDKIENLIHDNLDMLKQLFLEEWLNGRLNLAQWQERMNALPVSLPGPMFQLFAIMPQKNQNWEAIQVITSQFEQFHPIVITINSLVLAILNVDSSPEHSVFEKAAQNISALCNPAMLPCYSVPCSVEELADQYTICREYMERSLWQHGEVLYSNEYSPSTLMPEKKLLSHERNIVKSVSTNDRTKLIQEVNDLFAMFEEYKPTEEKFRDVILSIARSIQLFSENTSIYSQLEELFRSPYTPEVVHRLFEDAVSNDFTKYGSQVAGVLRYIQENCSNNLSLSDVAASLYISPSYLTRLLKSKTDMGFNDWLHKMRIEKAKELLSSSNLWHYEIAEQVGYRSYKIFSEYFGKIVGCSAKAYREELLRSSGNSLNGEDR